MDRKLCGIIKDVLPLYCDGVTREESNLIIKEHLQMCKDCHTYKKELEKDNNYNQNIRQKPYNNLSNNSLRNENSTNLKDTQENNQTHEIIQSHKRKLDLDKKETMSAEILINNIELDEDRKKFKLVAKKLRKRRIRNIISTITFICILYFIKITFFSNMIIDGNSMEPTLTSGKSYVLNKASYWFHSPKRGDIIVAMKDTNVYAKRIIGLPKEKIQMMDGFIYINDKKLEEEYLTLPIEFSGVLDDPIILGDNEYFVLGDNSTNSYDSRHEEFGKIMEENIIGKITRKSIFNFNGYTTKN